MTLAVSDEVVNYNTVYCTKFTVSREEVGSISSVKDCQCWVCVLLAEDRHSGINHEPGTAAKE